MYYPHIWSEDAFLHYNGAWNFVLSWCDESLTYLTTLMSVLHPKSVYLVGNLYVTSYCYRRVVV